MPTFFPNFQDQCFPRFDPIYALGLPYQKSTLSHGSQCLVSYSLHKIFRSMALSAPPNVSFVWLQLNQHNICFLIALLHCKCGISCSSLLVQNFSLLPIELKCLFIGSRDMLASSTKNITLQVYRGKSQNSFVGESS